jgi:hypothetical protein
MALLVFVREPLVYVTTLFICVTTLVVYVTAPLFCVTAPVISVMALLDRAICHRTASYRISRSSRATTDANHKADRSKAIPPPALLVRPHSPD